MNKNFLTLRVFPVAAPRMKHVLEACVAAALVHLSATAHELKAVSGHGSQVRIVKANGKVTTIREKFTLNKVALAKGGTVAAWLLNDLPLAADEGGYASNTLVVYRAGTRRTVTCAPMIRRFWFQEYGRKIAYDCGGLHFGGNEVLLDAVTLREIERFNVQDVPPEKRPPWSYSSPAFKEDE